jgi:hypothetical protein
MVGPYGISNSVNSTAEDISQLDTGSINHYATYIGTLMVSITGIVFSSVIMGNFVIDARLLVIIFLFLTFIPTSLNSTSSMINPNN